MENRDEKTGVGRKTGRDYTKGLILAYRPSGGADGEKEVTLNGEAENARGKPYRLNLINGPRKRHGANQALRNRLGAWKAKGYPVETFFYGLKERGEIRYTAGGERLPEATPVDPAGAITEARAETATTTEQELYPVLCEYLYGRLNVYPKRIDEKKSSNRHGSGGNHWLHPDVVGFQDFGSDWDREVQECASGRFDKRTRLWSFEVKRSLKRSNVRECFFQTVSNSSWAEFGYLVAAKIDDAAKEELRVLSAAHGIGVIRLSEPKPTESEILLPAQGRPEIDWDSVNRLTQENDDFRDYVSLVRDFYQTGRTRAGEWDVPKRKGAGR